MKMKRILIIGFTIAMFKITSAQEIELVQDPIADKLDSLAALKIFDRAFDNPVFPKHNKFNFSEDSVPVYDDYTYQTRLAKLNVNSPMDLVYNAQVKKYIEMYAMRKRKSVSRMMGVAKMYYPMFEQVFDRYNIPLELKHLAVIESALIPYAKSRAGAMGLWQFMYPTGKLYGLQISSYVDERCDPYKETVAAAEYLKNLYSIFKDWQMVLAAYNAGPGNISKAIRRSGGKKTYWEIRPYLPKETQGYVPAFIAATYVMTYGEEHNIYPTTPKKTYFEIDTVVVKEQMTFEQIAEALDIEVEDIQYFNPQYRKNVVPSGGNAICLPKSKIGVFLTNESEIYAAIKQQQAMDGTETITYKEVKKTYVVKKGEYLSTIARKYGVSVSEIKSWNYIGKKGVRPGKKLVIYVPENESKKIDLKLAKSEEKDAKEVNSVSTKRLAVNSAKSSNSKSKGNTKSKYHKVKSGESLYVIAKKYGVSIDEIKSENNLKSSNLQIGQTLKIPN